MINDSELILNSDGSIYHLGLFPEDIPEFIILVGDPKRVPHVSKHFDEIIKIIQIREFHSHIGVLNHNKILVISTGIGTDNIDIVLNELDACVNIDFKTKLVKEHHKQLSFIRLGTSGSIQENVQVDTFLISKSAIGLDGLMHFYFENDASILKIEQELLQYNIPWPIKPYFSTSDEELFNLFINFGASGITCTNTGFYGPQGRKLRLDSKINNIEYFLNDIIINNFNVTNLEMETAGIYGLGRLLGHKCISINAILANRLLGQFSKKPYDLVDSMIENVLKILFK